MRGGLVPAYRARPSALHNARAGVVAALCAALALTCVLYRHPLVSAGVVAAVVGAGMAARVGREVARAARLAVPLALLFCAVNPLVYAEGKTLLIRGATVLGHRFDITLEAVGAGALAGLSLGALVMVFGLFSACVDPDELLRAFRRVSYRSALTASLATRLVGVLAQDAGRMSDAARCRAEPPGRLAVAGAAVSGALERAVEVAAALEVRGYSSPAGRGRDRRPLSRHDLTVSASAVSIGALAVVGKLVGAGGVTEYPAFELAFGPAELAIALAIPLAAALPFAGRAARLGVARA